MSNDSHLSTILFFSLGLLFVQICFIFYLVVQRSTFIQYYVQQCDNAKKNEEIEFQIRCQAASLSNKQIILDENVSQKRFVGKFCIVFSQEETLESNPSNLQDPQFGILTVDAFDDQQQPIIPPHYQYTSKIWFRIKRKSLLHSSPSMYLSFLRRMVASC